MILGMFISGVSLYELHTNGFSWALVGCVLLGISLMTHQNSHHE